MLTPVAGEKRERTRRRLVQAAFDVVAERGFHAATVDQISAAAGVSTGALYANFKTKDDLLFAAFEEHLQWFAEGLEKVVKATDLNAAIADWIRSFGKETEQFLVFMEFWAYALRRDELRAQLDDRMAAMRAAVAEGIAERSMADGTSPALPPPLAAQVALALGRGLAFDIANDPKSVDEEAIAGLVTALVSAPR
jgi:AcrR family transcriptional regulator